MRMSSVSECWRVCVPACVRVSSQCVRTPLATIHQIPQFSKRIYFSNGSVIRLRYNEDDFNLSCADPLCQSSLRPLPPYHWTSEESSIQLSRSIRSVMVASYSFLPHPRPPRPPSASKRCHMRPLDGKRPIGRRKPRDY